MSFVSARIEAVSPYIMDINYAMTGGTRLSVVPYSETKLCIAHVDGSQVFASRCVETRKMAWLLFNPYKLMDVVASPALRKSVQKTWRVIDIETSDSKTAIERLSKLALLTNEADASYYAVYLLARKVKEGKVDRAQGLQTLYSFVLAAFAENDVPRIAFINGYLVQLRQALGAKALDYIETEFPGMTTENIAGNYDHILRW